MSESPIQAADPGVAVVILTLDQLERTRSCLARLRETEQAPHRVLVWDNGSGDGTVDRLREEFPEVLVHRHPTNLGVAAGRNAAAELAYERLAPSFLLFLDNDILVEPRFVDGLLRPFVEEKRVGQTQAKLRLASDPERLNDGGGCRIDFWLGRTRPVGYNELDRGQYDERKPCVACGGATMVPTDVFRRLGGFDTRFGPFGPEDLDFSLRLAEAGYLALYAPEAVAYHEVSHTFGRDYGEQYARHKARHWIAFLRRHASVPQKIGFFLLGAPFLAARLVLREGRRGNLRAVRGILRGLADAVRPSRRPGADG